MANVSRISGFKPVRHLNGSLYNGAANLYYVASAADEILVGDVVKLSGSGTSVTGIPGADLAGATDVPVGVVVGLVNPKLDQDGKMTSGSIQLDLPAAAQIPASGSGYILVADSPDIILEGSAGNDGTPFAVTDIGLNCSHANGSRDATTFTSPAYFDFGTEATTSTLNFQILGMARRVDNEVGTAVRLLARFNRHQYQSVGTTGI